MIKNNLRIIMAEKMIDSITELMQATGLSRNALNKLWHNQDIETVKLETLIKICQTLNIPLSKLIEYYPTNENNTFLTNNSNKEDTAQSE
ncbi:helix-turn-helix transcriptional regulator [Schinkia azotoformans]|uniref:helix-turn-helix domain-containing protein n=1 Tax=Schinkia azotoformans TaxID=1454 RepID=UPI002E22C4F9|nr:helix-turn-helix transcriptional regulator [Schinkia azotoformans]